MAAREAASAAAWAKAETDYANHDIKVSDIAKRLGLSSIQLSNTAKTLGWPMRSATRAPRLPAGSRDHLEDPLRGNASQKAQIKTAPSSRLRRPSPQGEKGESSNAQTETRPAGSTKRSRKTQKKNSPIALVQRVYATIDGELGKLEKQEGKTSQDRERASRALSQITNSLEKAVEMQRDIKKAMTKSGGRHDKEALAHAEDLRRAIAERLERLQRQRSLGKRSDGAE